MMRFFLLFLALSGVAAFTPAMEKTFRSTQSVSNSPLFRSSRVSSTERAAVLEQTELPSKLYFKKEKESPKILGGLKIGLRDLVVVTGASSGLGLACATTLAKTGRYFVVMAVRDIEKAKKGTCR
jgi:protochlorophyllide reductase